jgi:hypothetical protein
VLVAFGIEGHVDSLMLLFAALSVWAVMTDRPIVAGIVLGLAISAKLVLVVLLPWFVMRKRIGGVVAVATVVLTYLPYVGAGADLFASLTRFSASGTVLSFLSTIGVTSYTTAGQRAAVVIALAIILVTAAWHYRRYTSYAAAATGTLLMLMPIVHFWYLTWAIMFAALVPRLAWLAGAAAMVVYFDAVAVQNQTGVWSMPGRAGFVVWGAVFLGWALDVLVRKVMVTRVWPRGSECPS